MRSLDEVRLRAWDLRAECLAGGRPLLDGLKALIQRHGVTLAPTHPNALEGGDAELQPPVLLYDERFDADPARLCYVLAHELGHLEFHPRVRRRTYRANPIAAAIYLRQQDVGAIATYSHRLPEETEAITFANEVTCPSNEVFKRWRETPGTTLGSLTGYYGAHEELIAVQLVEGLYREALGTAPSASMEPLEERSPNPGQEQAILHSEGPALVLAGPGTGKTWTLVEHAIHILRSTEAVGDNLLVLTFSNEAAEELRTRIAPALNAFPGERVGVFTFHGFGYYLIRLFYEALGYKSPPAVLDDAGQIELLLDAFARSHAEAIFNLKDPEGAAQSAAEHINYLKQRLRTPDWLREKTVALGAEGSTRYVAEQRALSELWDAYEHIKKERGKVDFADLIAIPVDHLRSEAAALDLVREQFHRVLIDEYQDVSLATGELVRTICLDDGNVAIAPWVVGDPFQGIYAFLGADVRNVTEFAEVFGAPELSLVQSYRSSWPIVETANTLVSLMNSRGATDPVHRLLPAPGVEPYGQRPVRIIAAPTDAAEYQGIADLVSEWLTDPSIAPEDIAVLARRNVDVREITKALAARGHAATTSGIVTAEGAAGDLVAVLTLPEDPASALPRLGLALGPATLTLTERNEVVSQALAHIRGGLPITSFDPDGTLDQQSLAREIRSAYAAAQEGTYSADAFSASVTFLFESSLYLRRVLDTKGTGSNPVAAAESALGLVELATALGHAAAYRFSHSSTPPREARLGFASFFRRTLARSTPSAVAPRRTPGLIRVMTCHASKGLEFPLVIVAGQRLSGSTRRLSWLPLEEETLAASPDQASALLYVGITRAERAVVVSYAQRATATGKASGLPNLLKDWIAAGTVHEELWPGVEVEEKKVMIEPIWGTPSERRVRARAFGQAKDSCAIREYVQYELGLSFPSFEPKLYGLLVGRIRRFIDEALIASHDAEIGFGEEESLALLAKVWPASRFEDHRLMPFYHNVAQRAAKRWPDALVGSSLLLPDEPVRLDLKELSQEAGVDLASGLAAHFRDRAGRPTGIVLHLRSLRADLLKGKEEVKWGSESTRKDRAELALLRSYYESLKDEPFQAFIYSIEDGRLYPFAWPNGQYYPNERDRIGMRLAEVASARYGHEVDAGQCERCGVRVSCPYWTEAS